MTTTPFTETWGTERSRNLPEVTQQEVSETGSKLGPCSPRAKAASQQDGVSPWIHGTWDLLRKLKPRMVDILSLASQIPLRASSQIYKLAEHCPCYAGSSGGREEEDGRKEREENEERRSELWRWFWWTRYQQSNVRRMAGRKGKKMRREVVNSGDGSGGHVTGSQMSEGKSKTQKKCAS